MNTIDPSTLIPVTDWVREAEALTALHRERNHNPLRSALLDALEYAAPGNADSVLVFLVGALSRDTVRDHEVTESLRNFITAK